MIKTEFMELYEKLNLLEDEESFEELKKQRDALQAEREKIKSELKPLSDKRRENIRHPSSAEPLTDDEAARYEELSNKSYELYKKISDLSDRIYEIKSLEDGPADDEDWDKAISNLWPGDLEYDDLEIEVEGEFGGGEIPDNLPYDAPISYYPEKTLTGTLYRWNYNTEDLPEEELREKTAKYIGKDQKNILRSDLLNVDGNAFYRFLIDEYADAACEQAQEHAADGDFDYDDVRWNDPDDYEPEYEPDYDD